MITIYILFVSTIFILLCLNAVAIWRMHRLRVQAHRDRSRYAAGLRNAEHVVNDPRRQIQWWWVDGREILKDIYLSNGNGSKRRMQAKGISYARWVAAREILIDLRLMPKRADLDYKQARDIYQQRLQSLREASQHAQILPYPTNNGTDENHTNYTGTGTRNIPL